MLAALTGVGLSAAAGLNAFIPLVIVGVLARFTSLIELPSSLSWLASWPAIIVSLVLLLVEVVLDKIPAVDHVNDIIQTAVRPVVGAVIFTAASAADVVESSQFWQDHQWLGYIVGAIMSLTVHLGKATSRTAINAATAGTGSFAEDAVAVGLSFSAILFPWLVVFALLAMGAAVYRIVTTGRRRRQRKAAVQAESRAKREAREREADPWWRLFARGRED